MRSKLSSDIAPLLLLAALLAPAAPLAAQPPRPEPAEPEALEADQTPAPEEAPEPLVFGPYGPDTPEPGSVEAIATYTTAPEYLPPTVAYVPESETVPSPGDYLGHHAGTPGELSRVADVHGYFQALAAASERVRVVTVGTTEEGRDLLLAAISSEQNLADLDRLTEITRALADPRRTPREEAERLAAGGKAFYYLIGGLHSTETGSPEMLMELAYRLAVSERSEIRDIRDELVVLVTPVAEPDGRDRVVDWYYRHLKGRGLAWEELAEFASPPYWGYYAFHDNNRDGMQTALALTRAVHGVFHRFRPQVVHDLHESLPLLYISTGHGPYSRAADPVTINEWTQFAHREAGALQAMGLPGVWTWAFWDGWWPGYLVSVATNHNSVGRFYETFGNSSADTFTRDLSEVKFIGRPVTDVEWYRPWPPGKEVEWSLRNNTNYMQAGVLEALRYAALSRRDLLWNGWIKAERSLTKGRAEPPHAWVFPPDQDDPARLAQLINRLLAHQIEVHRLTADLTLGASAGEETEAAAEAPGAEPAALPEGGMTTAEAVSAEEEAGAEAADEASVTYPAGSFVVRMDQPHRNAAVNFLERQKFPADEPNPPYDDVAWTWPLLFGVEGETVDDPAILDVPVAGEEPEEVPEEPEPPPTRRRRRAEPEVPEPPPGPPPPALEPVETPLMAEGSVEGFGEEIFLLADRGQNALLQARVLLGAHQVDAAERPFEAEGDSYPAGSWIVYAPRQRVEGVARELGLVFQAVLAAPEVPRRHVVDLPRLGVVHTWTSTQATGWVRYTLDRERMPYELVSPDDLRRGGLSSSFDVLLFPPTRGDFKRIVHGIDPGWGPLAYTRTAEFPSHGVPDASPDITGGMGLAGLAEIQRFVESGGLLVALGNAGTLAVDGGLVRRVGRTAEGVRTPGSELSARLLQPEHPLAYGYPEVTSVFRGNGPLWEVPKRDRRRILMQFGADEPEWLEEVRAAAAPLAEEGAEDEAAVEVPGIVEEELPIEEVPPIDEEEPEEAGSEGAELELEPEETESEEEPEAEEGSEEIEELPELVLSGFVSEPGKVEGLPAVLELPAGRGRVVLFAFNPLHRYLNHSDFRLIWNLLLHWNDLPE